RIIVPNKEMIGAIVRNDTIVSAEVGTEVVLWLPADADAGRAAEELRDETAGLASVRVADMSPEGAVKLVVSGPTTIPGQRLTAEGELRAQCLARLRSAGLLSVDSQDRTL
ncbi:MAG: hypothetical protein JHC95_23295, partial [Solirubrobacteraceae bacterium]|nr:hypothetical protein [Solirubrobacteraceae bacterium]